MQENNIPIADPSNNAFAEKVKKAIEESTVMILGVSDAVACGAHHSPPKEGPFMEMDDGFLYTIGHHIVGRPEIMVLIGPNEHENPISRYELLDRFVPTQVMINHLVAHWDEEPVHHNETVADPNGRVYLVADVDCFKSSVDYREVFTTQASEYHRTKDYRLLILQPLGQLVDGVVVTFSEMQKKLYH